MSLFTANHPTIDSYWRAVILFGKNVASYKFALAKSLLEIAEDNKSFISLEELAVYYSEHILNHLKIAPKQTTSQSSEFLEICKKYNEGKVSRDELISITTKKGFNYVLNAFHIVNRESIPIKFFDVSQKGSDRGLVLTDEIFKLQDISFSSNLPFEVESRWNLIEKSWELNISRNLLDVRYDENTKLFFVQKNYFERVDVTSSRNALNGYQKGKCFYCFDDISIKTNDQNFAEIDHLFPFVLETTLKTDLNIHGVWNLVLACPSCNRGIDGKFSRVPSLKYLNRLHRRNEFLIESHHPLRETLMRQTGEDEISRRRFLQNMYNLAKQYLIFEWETELKGEEVF